MNTTESEAYRLAYELEYAAKYPNVRMAGDHEMLKSAAAELKRLWQLAYVDKPAGECDCGAELTDSRMDSIMLLEHLKVAIEHLEHERDKYRLTPVYLESAIQNLKQTARDYDYKLKGAKP